MSKQCKREQKIDGRTAPAKRRRALVAAYEAQIGGTISPATRSLIARTVSIEVSLEAIEADQVAGKQIDAEKHARLAGGLARLLDRLGMTVRPGVSATLGHPPFDGVKYLREQAAKSAQEKATREGWSDAERDRYAEQLFKFDMSVC